MLSAEERAAIDTLTRQGRVKPAALVRAAASETHPLHHRFTWDDTEAAHQHRLQEARSVLRLYVHIVNVQPIRGKHHTGAVLTRGLLYDPREPSTSGYAKRSAVVEDPTRARGVLRRTVRSAITLLSPLADVAEACGVLREYKAATAALQALVDRL